MCPVEPFMQQVREGSRNFHSLIFLCILTALAVNCASLLVAQYAEAAGPCCRTRNAGTETVPAEVRNTWSCTSTSPKV